MIEVERLLKSKKQKDHIYHRIIKHCHKQIVQFTGNNKNAGQSSKHTPNVRQIHIRLTGSKQPVVPVTATLIELTLETVP